MRKIKFRIWDKEIKDMIVASGKDLMIDTREKMYETNDGIVNEITNPDDFIIMQFTGMLDCKGKEICEGDIVKFGCPGLEGFLMFGYVQWWRNVCMFGIRRYKWVNKQGQMVTGRLIGEGGFPLHHVLKNTIEIIGNRYENPQLLEMGGDLK